MTAPGEHDRKVAGHRGALNLHCLRRGQGNNQAMGAASALLIPAGVAAALLACVVRGRRRVPAAGAAAIWLCAAAVLLAGCGGPGQARPGAPGAGGSRVTSGAWRADASGTATPSPARPRGPATRPGTRGRSPGRRTGPSSWPTAVPPLAICTASPVSMRSPATRWEMAAPSFPAGARVPPHRWPSSVVRP